MGVIANLLVNLRARTSEFDSRVGKSGRNLKRLGDQAKAARMGMGLLKTAMAAVSVAVIGRFAKQTVMAFAEQQAASEGLKAALESVQRGAASTLPRMQAFAAGIQRTTVIGDEAVLSLMTLGAGLGRFTGEGLEKATLAAIGLSKRLGVDTTTAMTLVAKAGQGSFETLSRYGLKLDETLGPQGKFNELLKIGAQSFSLATAEAETLQGRIAQLGNAWGDLKEQIGGRMAPTATKTAQGLTAFLQKPEDLMYQFGDQLAGILGMTGTQKTIREAIKRRSYVPAPPVDVAGIQAGIEKDRAGMMGFKGLLEDLNVVQSWFRDYTGGEVESSAEKFWAGVNAEVRSGDLWGGSNAMAAMEEAMRRQGGENWLAGHVAAAMPAFANIGAAALASDRMTHRALPGDAAETLQKLMAKQVHEAEETNRRLDDLRARGGLG